MELRILRYFLAVAQEGSISAAAEYLHLTQPTLSRQMMELEEELGRRLFVRGGRGLRLNEEGLRFQKRAQEIVELADKTLSEYREEDLGGDLCVGAGESAAMRLVAQALSELHGRYPRVRCHIHSGNAEDLIERLDKGLLDFCVFVEPVDLRKYEYLSLPHRDRWGVLVREDDPLAARDEVRPEDLRGSSLLISRQPMARQQLDRWLGDLRTEAEIGATYNLLFNAALMVEAGFGRALCLDEIVEASATRGLRFLPMEPPLEAGVDLVWKKYQVFSRPAERFLEIMRQLTGERAE